MVMGDGEDRESRKMFYSVGEVAERLGVEPHRIRYWSDEVDRIDPDKTPGGNRQFRREDLEILETLHELVETEKYTLEGAEKQLEQQDVDQPDDPVQSIINECDGGLEEINEFVESI